jgi:hypothetical protein
VAKGGEYHKHTVIAGAESPAEAKDAVAWATTVYDRIIQRYGLKHEQPLASTPAYNVELL